MRLNIRKRIRLAIVAALAVAVPGALIVASLPSEAAVAPTAGGTYTLAAANSGRCIDVVASSTDNGGLLQQWGCHADQANQQWTVNQVSTGVYTLVSGVSGKCIDVPTNAVAGTQLQQWNCGDATKTGQQFKFAASGTGTYSLSSVRYGLCLSVKDSTANGAALVVDTCATSATQQWGFTLVSGGGGTGTWSNTADGFAKGTTGGAGGTTVTVTTYADLVKYATASAAYVIKVQGTLTSPTMGAELKVTSNKTIVGVGTTGRISKGGFFLGPGVKNVIIRNLTIGDTAMADDDPDDKTYDYDGIQMDTASNVWIDHNTFQNINDGYIDSRIDTTNVTVSWNKMGNHNKTFGIGWTTNVTARMTIHHNYIWNSNQRNPSADNLQYVHLYNNYQQNNTSYGNYARGATKMVIENSYFESVKDPYFYDTGGLKQTGSVCVSCTGQQETGGTTFTPSSYYSYTLDPAANVPGIVKAGSGPQASIVY